MPPPRKPKPEPVEGHVERKRPQTKAPYDYTGTEFEIPTVSMAKASKNDRLTPENLELMRRGVASGVPVPTVATAIGCGTVWRHWGVRARNHERQGRPAGWGEGESPELLWLLTMDQAKAEFEALMVGLIGRAAQYDWRAAAYLIERRAPRRWYMQARMEIFAEGKKVADIGAMSTAQLLQLARGITGDENVRLLPAESAEHQPVDAVLIEEDDCSKVQS